ncbi:thiol reductant ABC exporter subunit CydD [Paenibacillus massiliensis]|uniref:thiol reductant ABC exporter subunit CydD n=1 Tax=Paenibacillus massiliensis TaxID=225917 RepID=UPI0004280CCB|nr:thiol reductant ABC exporter subunit CydD [Paenibacillus massiliensis]
MNRKAGLLSQELSKQRKHLILLAIISLMLGIAIIAQSALLAEAVQKIFVEGASLSSVMILLGILLAVMTLRVLLSYGNGKVGLYMAGHAKTNMRAKVLQRLTHATMTSTLRGQTGGRVSLALDAVDEGDSYFSQYMPRMLEAAIIPILILVVVFTQHANSGFIMLFTAPFIPLFMILVGLKTRNKSEEKFAQLAEFSGTFLDSLQGLVTLKLYGRAHRQTAEIERSSLNYRDATMGILRIAFTNTFMLESIVMLSIGIVALELAIQLLVFKALNFHTAFFILLLVPEFYSLLKNTGTAFHSGRTSMGAIRKVEELLVETSNERAAVDSKEETGSRAEGSNHAEQPTQANKQIRKLDEALLATSPSIELDHVQFDYGTGSFQLVTGSVSLAPGEHIAIVGKSGSGKTTLLHLIAGLLKPTAGAILVNGSPLQQYDESDWYKGISYITQHPYIFAGTLADNIAIGAGPNVSREEIKAAAIAAGLASVVDNLQQGYDTYVGEGGRGLSGGEKQRLALARAFLKRPSIILFDEPTVGLDLYTERILQQSIATLSQSATTITVAHRLYTIQHADQILFMDNGKIVDSGRHEELLERLSPYAELVSAQRGGDGHE